MFWRILSRVGPPPKASKKQSYFFSSTTFFSFCSHPSSFVTITSVAPYLIMTSPDYCLLTIARRGMFSALQILFSIFPKLEAPPVWMIPPLQFFLLYSSIKQTTVKGLTIADAAVWASTLSSISKQVSSEETVYWHHVPYWETKLTLFPFQCSRLSSPTPITLPVP